MNEQSKSPILHYASPQPRSDPPSTRALRGAICVAFMVPTGLFVAGLDWLEHVPYRPPQDMSTLLGGPELAVVEFLKWVFASVFAVALLGLICSLFFRWGSRPGKAGG